MTRANAKPPSRDERVSKFIRALNAADRLVMIGAQADRSGRLLNHFATKRTCIAASGARPPQDNGRGNEDGRIRSDDDADKEGERKVV